MRACGLGVGEAVTLLDFHTGFVPRLAAAELPKAADGACQAFLGARLNFSAIRVDTRKNVQGNVMANDTRCVNVLPRLTSIAALIMLGCGLAPAALLAQDLAGVDDVSGDGTTDVAQLEPHDGSGVKVTIYSGASGQAFRAIEFLDVRYRAFALEQISEMPATGLPALAVVASRVSNNRHLVEVRDAASIHRFAEGRTGRRPGCCRM